MDVMSLEHNFGNEYQTSIKQLFQFFCNNLNLGQWESAKACLDQLISSQDVLKFDFNQLLTDIILDPTLYWLVFLLCFFVRLTNSVVLNSNGSDFIKSPYHLSLLLYEYCNEKKILNFDSKLKIYDEILLKFFLFAINYSTNSDNENEKVKLSEIDKECVCNLIDFFKSTTNMTNSIFDDKNNRSFLVKSLLNSVELTINVFKLLMKYNKSCEFILFKIHVEAIDEFLSSSNDDNFDSLLKLLSCLFVYKIKFSQQIEISLLNKCFKKVCAFVNQNGESEGLFTRIYSSLLSVNESTNEDDDLNFDVDDDAVKYLDFFVISQYESNKQMNFDNDGKYEILNIVKKFYAEKPNYFWKYLFLFCVYEKKIFVQSLIVSLFHHRSFIYTEVANHLQMNFEYFDILAKFSTVFYYYCQILRVPGALL